MFLCSCEAIQWRILGRIIAVRDRKVMDSKEGIGVIVWGNHGMVN